MNSIAIKPNYCWATAWQDKLFRKKILISVLLLTILFSGYPAFFQYLERRSGATLNDVVLNAIPPTDVSVPIFLFIWSTTLLAIIRAVKQPLFFLTFVNAYCVLCILRYLTLYFVPLDAPKGLIPLIDPISNMLYGKKFITKDLFFSGHTSTLFLFCLSFQQRLDKYFSLGTALLVGILVLIQHVHYTIDVIAAPFFAFLSLIISKKWIFSSPNNSINHY
ncbi:sphingomyelin synthase family protein [Ferruginibacter albus]|uniref:sphingomyelin synthase family protein n=1 Tax=Ferruginibacter albus TaxID=2875540 RepID=UPI001CC69DBB|nr:sphingomyelin synthase family protein [Ferruginibacter albus]UAY53377.1 sphingomyelin synthase family protein [Ferruginibacter albus]